MARNIFYRLHYATALIPALLLISMAILLDVSDRDARRTSFVSDHAQLVASTINLRLGKLLEVTNFCASSPALIERLDLANVAENCGRYASLLGGWVVVIEIGAIHRQILNTRPDAPTVLPSYKRSEELPTLLAIEMRSRQSGQAELSDVFSGIIYPKGIVSAGQYVRLPNGRSGMLYVSLPVRALSDQLAEMGAGGEAVFGLIDPTRRIVARSVGIDSYMFAEAPSWILGNLASGKAGASLGVPGPAEIGGTWDVGYHPVGLAKGWMAVSARPSHTGVWSGALESVPSGLAFLGVVLSALLLLVIVDRDRVIARVGAAQQARGEADQKNQEKSRLLATFAHDIRNPLISLIATLEILEEKMGVNSEEVRMARASAEGLLQLVDDILELSFLGSGEFTLHPSPVDLRRLAEDLLSQTRCAADRKGLILQIQIDDSLPSAVQVDRLRLQQVLSNLLINAVKYTETGTVSLKVTWEPRADALIDVIFAVRDTGIGFAPEDLPNVLREFGRLDRDAEMREQGVGLGLAICQRILRAMGSRLSVESLPRRGSVFSFRLTLLTVSSAVSASEARPLGGVVILYAEDEPVIRHVTARRLTEAGATVIEALDGADAIRQLASLKPDLLLLDLQMPGLDGVAVIRRLRTATSMPNYPIFVLTSHISGPQAADARSAGADVVFTKPVQVLPLASALRSLHGKGGTPVSENVSNAAEGDVPLVEVDEFFSAVKLRDGAFEEELLAMFENAMRHDLGQLSDAVAEKDVERARYVAHRCRGLSQVMGAKVLSLKLRAIEQEAESTEAGGSIKFHDDLNELLSVTITRMRLLLNGFSKGGQPDRSC